LRAEIALRRVASCGWAPGSKDRHSALGRQLEQWIACRDAEAAKLGHIVGQQNKSMPYRSRRNDEIGQRGGLAVRHFAEARHVPRSLDIDPQYTRSPNSVRIDVTRPAT
jgi:hypothetical protein